MADIKVSNLLYDTAQAVQAIARNSGIEIKITDIYKDENLEGLALIGGLLRQQAEKASGEKIGVLIG